MEIKDSDAQEYLEGRLKGLKDWQIQILRGSRALKERLLREPPPPGMIRPFPDNPFVHGNAAAIAWLERRRNRRSRGRPETVWVVPHPDSDCIQARPDLTFPCLHPQQPLPRRWWVVSWLEPLSPFALPLRGLQPAPLQKRYRKRFCCAEAAEMFAAALRERGCVEIVISPPVPEST